MRQKKILIIEDEEDMLYALTMLLEAHGYAVSSAGDGKQGYEKARRERPDLIILDLMLPTMGGYKVCRLLKFDEKYKRIPIVMLTARAQKKDKLMGNQVGADAYLTKPFESDALLATIDDFFKKT